MNFGTVPGAEYLDEEIAAEQIKCASREEAKEILDRYGSTLEFAPQHQSDRELCEIAIRSAGDAYRYVSPELKLDARLAGLAACSNHTVILDVPAKVLEQREFWLTALAGDYRLTARLPKNFCEDKELFIVAATRFTEHSDARSKGVWFVPYDVDLTEHFGPDIRELWKGRTLAQAIEACRIALEKESLVTHVPPAQQPARRMKI